MLLLVDRPEQLSALAEEAVVAALPVESFEDLPVGPQFIVVRPRQRPTVGATLASVEDAPVAGRGFPYRTGAHYLVDRQPGLPSLVRTDIFGKMYRQVGAGRYRLRGGLCLRATIIDRSLRVATLEGERLANPGDWIVIGVADELWPVPNATARAAFTEVAHFDWTSATVTISLVSLMMVVIALLGG